MARFLATRTRFLVSGALFLSLAVLAGCGPGGADVVVVGKVTVGSVTANSGNVTFTVAGKTGSSAILADGSYRITNIPAGEAQITVTPLALGGGATKGTPPPLTSGMPGEAVGKPVPIPAKYGKAETSGLTFPVKPGDNKYDIELTK